MNERSFHIFYQLFTQKDLLNTVYLDSDPLKYKYLALSECVKVNTIDDAADFQGIYILAVGYASC